MCWVAGVEDLATRVRTWVTSDEMTTARKSNEAPVLVAELLSRQPPARGYAHARVQIRERVAASAAGTLDVIGWTFPFPGCPADGRG